MLKKNIRVDPYQGIGGNDQAFGFVCILGVDEFQGWFFEYPGSEPVFEKKDLDQIIGSLDPDCTSNPYPQIPYGWAERALRKYLMAKLKARKVWEFRS